MRGTHNAYTYIFRYARKCLCLNKILITFNDGKETAPIIEPIQMNDAQSAWEGMSKQAVNQITQN